MHSIPMTPIRTLLANPDRPDRDALVAVIDDTMYGSIVLACLAQPGSLAQIAAALEVRWAWDCAGWERHVGDLVEIITDPRCLSYEQMLRTWSRIPGAVGTLRDRSADLVAWAEQRLNTEWYANLATLLGPSDAAARLLVNATHPIFVKQALRRWSMATDPYDPAAWQAMIDADLLAALHNVRRWGGFPAWGWSAPANANAVRSGIIDDLLDGWPLDHPSIRGRIAWLERYLERHVDADPEEADPLAFIASVAGSDALADAVCALIWQEDSKDRVIRYIVHEVPWKRLHPRIRIAVVATGYVPQERDEQEWSGREGRVVRFWNPDVPVDDLRAGTYAGLILWLKDRQNVQEMIALLDTLPPERRARFEQIVAWHMGGRSEATTQPAQHRGQ